MRLGTAPWMLVIAVAPLAWGLDPAKVEGSLTVEDEKVSITHGYALLYEDEEGVLEGAELRVLLTDREVSADLLAAPVLTRLDSLARAGKVRGVLLRFDPKSDSSEVYGTVFFPPSSPDVSMPFFTETKGGDGIPRLEAKDGRVSGDIRKAIRKDAFFEDVPEFGYQAAFDLPVAKREPVTSTLKGDAAAKSPQAAAVLAFEEACRKGDFDGAAKVATEARMAELGAIVKQVGKEAFVEQVKEWFPDGKERKKQITEVVLRGTKGLVIIEEEGGKNAAPVLEDGGKWKVD